MILAGDIGGTSTRLAAFDEAKPNLVPECVEIYKSSDHATLEGMIALFLKTHKIKVTAVCIGFAGPVKRGRAVGTNLPWVISANDLAANLDLRHASIINDLEANAYGIEVLSSDDYFTLNVGERDDQGNAGLISAGTGLGEAGLAFNGERLMPFATEGGHCDFAPKTEIEIELLQYLQKRYKTVSWERVVSGMGLVNIYTFLRDTGRGTDPLELDAEIMTGGGAAISHAALQGKSKLCDMTLNMFISLYGAEAGNLALKLLATGGMYLGGGIAPKIIERLKTPLFFDAFVSKGRFESLLRAIPVQVILNDQTALLGAAHYASLKIGAAQQVAGRV
jgi:glucokinase